MATAKKTSRKSTSKKKTVSAKATAKKVTAKKSAAVVKSQPKQMVTLKKLKKFNLFASATNAIFAILSAVLLSARSVEFYLPYSAKDELASLDSTVLGPAYEAIVTVELRYLIAFIFGLSAVFSLLLATAARTKYEEGVAQKVSGLKWIFLGVISALSLEFASIIGGVTDVVTLKLIALMVFAAAMLGWVSEIQSKNSGKNLATFYIGLVIGAFAWLPLVVGLIATSLNGAQIFEWYVYALAAVLLAGFVGMTKTHYKHLKNGATADEYLQIEGKYLSMDYLLKVAVFVVVFVALFD